MTDAQCANCELPLPLLVDQYGPPGAPICYACHMGIEPSREPDGLVAARAELLNKLGQVEEWMQDAEGWRERADEAESDADDLRAELAKTYGLDSADLRKIEREVKWQLAENVDWTKLPALTVTGKPAPVSQDAASLPLCGVLA